MLDELGYVFPLAALGFGYGAVGQGSIDGVDALGDAFIFADGGCGTLVCETEDVGEGGVGEGEGGSIGDGRRHIGDAVMDHAIDEVGGVRVRGGMSGFDAAALINGYVDDDSAFLHLRDHGAGDDLGSRGSGNEDSADDEVGFAGGVGHVVGVGVDALQAAVEDVIEFAEAVEIVVEERNFRTHAERNLGGIGADDASTEDADVARSYPGDAAEKDTSSAMLFFKVRGANLDGHPSGNFRHGSEEGESVGAITDGLVGDAGDLLFEKCVGKGTQGREMEVGKEDESGAEVTVLALDGFLDLDDHVGEAPDVVGRTDDLGSGGLVVVVREGGEGAGFVLDEDGVAGFYEGLDAGGGDTYAAFVVFHFLRDAYDHGCLSEGLRRAVWCIGLIVSRCLKRTGGATSYWLFRYCTRMGPRASA